jgi:SOS-response transcriptional repressor LexA
MNPSDDTLTLARAFLGDDLTNVYALRVKGDGFASALIADGDILILRRVTEAEAGHMVALRVQDRTIVRRWHPLDDGRVELRAEAPGVEPLVFGATDVTVQGRVIGIIRNHEEAKAAATVERKAQPRKAAPATETLFRRRA